MFSAREHAARLADLLSRERVAMAEFLVALADFDRKRLWLDLGHSGLFSFLHRELGLSKAAAFYRKTAADLIQRFPEIIEPLRDGRLCMTAIAELAKVITLENRHEIVPRFFHCSKQEAKAVSAAIAPCEAPPMRTVVTAVRVEASPERTVRPGELTISETAPAEAAARMSAPVPEVPPIPEPPRKRDTVEPLTAELNRFHVTVSRRFLEKLEKARSALSHSHPGASTEEILEVGLDLVLARDAKRKGLVTKPRTPTRTAGTTAPEPGKSDQIPASVKRAVWIRDQGRCQYPLASGGICGSTLRLEFDHIQPRALGGPSTVENVRVACDLHNDRAARLVFGDEFMNRFTKGPRSGATEGDGRRAGTQRDQPALPRMGVHGP